MPEAEIDQTVSVFQRFDINGDGKITKHEFSFIMKSIDANMWTKKKIDGLWNACDANKTGHLDFEEFVAWLYGSRGSFNAKKCILRNEDTFSSSEYVRFVPGNVEDHYTTMKKLGEGAFGKVYLAKHKVTGALRALKTISLKHTNQKALDSEIQVLKVMDNPNIIKLYEFFKDSRMAYLVMEVCSGGSLVERIIEDKTFSEKQAACVMEQACGALLYMHNHFLCHRDLKTDNLLLKDKSPILSCTLQIGDFGLTSKFGRGKPFSEVCGTPFYMAPEVIKGKYNEKCDVWAMGVIMRELLSGNPPFNGNSVKGLFRAIQLIKYRLPKEEWKGISPDAKHLIKEIFVAQKSRPSAEQIMMHRWIKEHAPEGNDNPLEAQMYSNLESYSSANKMKKMALHVIAQRLNDDEIQALKDTFVSLDVNRDGVVKLEEFEAGLANLGENGAKSEQEIRKLFQAIDADANAHIDYSEFLAAALDKQKFGQEQACWTAFHAFDLNGNGEISRKELQHVIDNDSVKDVMGSAALKRVMAETDKNEDGFISFEEFMDMMRRQ